ncbi:hypothetical protein FHS95_001570 [Sphingomonas naasensis]|uniref:Uncharacterized protein n=1 Tax=Sphingomonas naasensis TaxID=1344951 RepID=A0A4S1WGP4_9SPHN|nr:hypothetical protein [Sphingomonas naasensis]NIJ19901.1 hypothetical protein [Sphingomonas naasensis]TGX39976.1 hypothetical protein E5A74_15455 [Sphingomonas naasensis]
MELGHFLAALALAGAPLLEDKLTNDSVVALSAAGLGDEAIIAKIKSSEVAFDLSTEQMIALKQRGVSGPVVAAMLTATGAGQPAPVTLSMDSPDPMRPHPAGLYMLVDDPSGGKMTRIDATVSNQAKTGGMFGYALTGGIASMSVKASIQNETARVASQTATPHFYFFFDESNGVGTGAWTAGTAATIVSPNEMTLIKLSRKKGRREARVGSVNIGGAKTGVMDKDRLGFNYEMVRPGVFKVTPTAPLAAGEYGFIYSINGGGGGGALTARIFDFSVR